MEIKVEPTRVHGDASAVICECSLLPLPPDLNVDLGMRGWLANGN